MEEEVIPNQNINMETQIIQEGYVDEIVQGIPGEEIQTLVGISSTSLEVPSSAAEEENENEPMRVTEEITMEESGIDLQIVEESGRMYVISAVLDEETGEMINVVTPCDPGMTIHDSVETVNVMTGTIIPGSIIQVDGVKMEMQIQDEIEQGHSNSSPSQECFITESDVLNEHDYGEVVRRHSVVGEIQNSATEIELINQPMPMEYDGPLSTKSGFSGQIDEKSIIIVNTKGSHGILNKNQVDVREQKPTSSTNKPETNNINDPTTRWKKVGTNGKIRNIDLMDLPFSYAGQSFTVQAQKLILNVYDFFKRNKGDVYALDRIGTPQEKAGRCLNISSSVIGKIRKRYKSGRLEVPGKKRAKIKRVLDKVDAAQEQVLRGMLHEMMSNGTPTTVPALLAAAREKINFVGSRTSFRRVLQRMGFKYGKQNKKVVVVDGVRVSNSSQPQSQPP